MAKPASRQEFKDYILRKIGAPSDLFLDNKYTRIYYDIICNAELRNENGIINEYTENHHIIPKCMIKNNVMVRLTAREHFIAHYLLTKMVLGNNRIKMIWAFSNMKRDPLGKRYINSRLYSSLKGNYKHSKETIEKFSNSIRETLSNKVMSDEERERRSASQRGKIRSAESCMKTSKGLKGKKKTKEHIENAKIGRQKVQHKIDMSGANNPMYGLRGELSPIYGRKQTDEHKNKRLSKIKGRTHSEETKKKMHGKKWYNNGVERKRLFDHEEVPEGFVKGLKLHTLETSNAE